LAFQREDGSCGLTAVASSAVHGKPKHVT
jgi:hypothetical protein